MKNEVEVHYHVHENDFDEFNRIIGFRAAEIHPIAHFLLFQRSLDVFITFKAESYQQSLGWRETLAATKRWMVSPVLI